MPYRRMRGLLKTVVIVRPNGIDIATMKNKKILLHFTIKITGRILNNMDCNDIARQVCLIRNNGQLFLKNQEQDIWCLLPSIMKDIVYGTAQRQTAMGAVNGMP